MPATLRISAEVGSLADVQGFVQGEAERLGVPDLLIPKLDLVSEEIFVNVANHAYPQGGGEAELRCFREADGSEEFFCLSIRDWGPPFNPLEQDAPSLDDDLDDRPIGGLGIFFVNEMADRCAYERDGDANEFRACFKV